MANSHNYTDQEAMELLFVKRPPDKIIPIQDQGIPTRKKRDWQRIVREHEDVILALQRLVPTQQGSKPPSGHL